MLSALSLSLFYLTACKNDTIIEKQRNAAPNILIMSHSNGAEVRDGYVETFRAAVSDEDHDFEELKIAWYVDDDLVCDWSTSNLEGEALCEIRFEEGDQQVIAEVRDPEGAAGRFEVDVDVLPTYAPEIEMLTPVTGGNYYASELIQFSALISDAEDVPEDLLVTWTSSADGELILDTSINAEGEMSDYTYLTEGNHAIELRVEDSTGKVSTEEVVILVGGNNNEPTCAFTAPMDGDTFLLGDSIVFSGSAVDVDIPNNQLLVSISSNLDGVVQSLSPFSDGSFSFAIDSLTAGTHTMTLSVEDDVGAVCTTGMLLSVGTAPVVNLDEPLDGALFELAEIITFKATVSDGEDQPSDIMVVWTSDLDGELHTGNANSQGVSQFSFNGLSAGVHSISVSATDTTGLVSDDLISFRVNTRPMVNTIAFTPDPVFSNNNLSMSATSSDGDGQNVSQTYEWYEDGVSTGFTGTSIAASELQVNEVWTVRVTPNDGYQDGPYTEASITVSNTGPVVNSVEINPINSVYNDTILTCTGTASDIDQTIAPTFQWTVDGQTYSGASLDLSTVGVMPNYVVACNAIATDDWGASDMMTTSVTVENRAPVLLPVNITPGSTGQVGDTLTCESLVNDPDGEILTPIYTWSVNGFAAGSGNVFTLSSIVVDPSDLVTCTATVTDAYGESDLAIGSFTVVNELPIISNISIEPVEPTTFDTVTCSAIVTDPDGITDPTVEFLFENITTGTTLYPNAATNDEATLNLLDVSMSVGDELACHVTVTDNGGAVVMDTETTTIVNSQPTIDSIEITPNASVEVGTVLTCSATSSDYEDGTLIPTYEWTTNGAVVSSVDTYVVDGAEANLGDVITCTVTVIDSDNQMVSDDVGVVVQNTAPVVSDVSISPSFAVTNDAILTCTPTIEDPNETVIGNFVWRRNGNQMAVGSTVDLSNFNVLPTDVIDCVVSATDNQGASDSASASVTIGNRSPVVGIPTISNTAPEVGETITCSAIVTDDDGEVPTVTYEWTDGQNTLGTAADLTLSASDFSAGDVVVCTVTAEDNFGATAGSSNLATIADSGNAGCGLTACDSNLDLGGGQSIDMVLLTAGTFTMGSPSTEEGHQTDEIQHTVTLTNDFYVMTTEVTQGMFAQLMGYDSHAGQSTSNGTGTYGVGADFPAYHTTWHMSAAFANAVTQRHNVLNGTGLQECYTCTGSGQSVTCSVTVDPYMCDGYRLLTEAEWEYAARSASADAFWTINGGGNIPSGLASDCSQSWTLSDGTALDDLGWYCGNNNQNGGAHGSKEVATREPNSNGLYDMHGNIGEWVNDWYDDYPTGSVTNPSGPSTSFWKVYRGGYWGSSPAYLRSASRNDLSPGTGASNIGFRLGIGVLTQPTSASLAISNEAPIGGQDDLHCAVISESTDPNGNTVTYTFDWTVNGQVYTGATTTTVYGGDTIPASETSETDVWQCTITPNNGVLDGPQTVVETIVYSDFCGQHYCDTSLDLGGGIDLDLVLIPNGTYDMGSPTTESFRAGDEDQHTVTLTNDFYVMETEFTQEMFAELMGYECYDGESTDFGIGPTHPAYYVSWHMAAHLANLVTERYNTVNGVQLRECYDCTGTGPSTACTKVVEPYQCTGFRLLTEAEWEYAARGETTAAFWSPIGNAELTGSITGNTTILSDGSDLSQYGWYYYSKDNPYGAKAVGLLNPNLYGLYDMAGNVYEWTHDMYSTYPTGPVTNPLNDTSGVNYVYRSGFWSSGPSHLRSAKRWNNDSNLRTLSIGFRLGLTHDDVE